MGEASHKPRVVERYRDGATMYDVVRLSWEEPGVDPCEVVLRSFLTRADADRWVEDIGIREHILSAR